jgi:hypothetical protein
MNKSNLKKFYSIKTVEIEGETFYFREPSIPQVIEYQENQAAFFDRFPQIRNIGDKEKKRLQKIELEQKEKLTDVEAAKLLELKKLDCDLSPEEAKEHNNYMGEVFKWLTQQQFNFVFTCLCDENGKRLFQAGEESELELVNKNVYQQLANFVWGLVNPPSNEAVEESKKN